MTYYSTGEVIAFYLLAAALVLGTIYFIASSAARSDKILKVVRKRTNGLRRMYQGNGDDKE